MKYEAIISKSGSITIPATVRKQLGIKPGQTVKQSVERNKIILDFGAAKEKSVRTEGRKSK